MRLYRPVNIYPDEEIFTQAAEVWDFGAHGDTPALFAGEPYLELRVGLIRSDGTRATHRGSHYEWMPDRPCIIVTREGTRYTATREGVNAYLTRQLQHPLIEMEGT